MVEHEHGLDPYSGVVFVFRPKRVDRIKVLWRDGTGSRIEASGAEPVRLAGGSRRGIRLSRAQFEALFEGLGWRWVWGPRVRQPLAAA